MSLNRRIVRSVAGLLFLMGACAAPCLAQTWQWSSLTHPAFGPPLRAQSTVALTPSEITFTYTARAPSATAPGGNRQIVIASCRATLSDVARASAMRTAGRVFFLLELKPEKLADCDSGKKAIAALPGTDFAQVSQIASAVNRACCSPGAAAAPRHPRIAAAVVPRPSPAPPAANPSPAPREASPSPLPATPRPRPAAKRGGSMSVVDWVETDGLFAFVRVHNTGGHAIALGGGALQNCTNVEVGCGAFGPTPVLGAHQTVTVATVASIDQRRAPSFTYQYTASAGGRDVTRQGFSKKKRPAKLTRISEQDRRAAEALAIGRLRGPAAAPAPGAAPSPVPASLPARLVTRGASRLAVGERGTAVVRVLVSASGDPEEASIVSITNRKLTAAAIETAISSTYSAATKFGRPVSADYIATFSFNGEDPATADIPVWRRALLPSPLPSATPASAPLATPAPAPVATPAGKPGG